MAGGAAGRAGACLVVRCEDGEPCEDCPQSVLLAHVVRARAKRLLAAEQRRVAGGRAGLEVRVHQVAEELPARRRLEARDAERGRDAVDGCAGRHRARDRAQPALPRELREEVRVRGDDGERVGGRDEAAAAQDHIAVAVTVAGRAKVGQRPAGGRRVGRAVAQQAERGDELGRVGEVGVGVAAAKVGQRRALAQRLLGAAHELAEHGEQVGAG